MPQVRAAHVASASATVTRMDGAGAGAGVEEIIKVFLQTGVRSQEPGARTSCGIKTVSGADCLR